MSDKKTEGIKIVSDNRQARFQYEILETYETGIELVGTEVKSIREGRVNLRDGFALVRNNEVFLHNVHISPHKTASLVFNHDPTRTRKLLLKKDEIRKVLESALADYMRNNAEEGQPGQSYAREL